MTRVDVKEMRVGTCRDMRTMDRQHITQQKPPGAIHNVRIWTQYVGSSDHVTSTGSICVEMVIVRSSGSMVVGGNATVPNSSVPLGAG